MTKYPNTNCWIRYNGQGNPYRICVNQRQWRLMKEEAKRRQIAMREVKRRMTEEEDNLSNINKKVKDYTKGEYNAYMRVAMRRYREGKGRLDRFPMN